MTGERGLFQRGGRWGISYFHDKKHIRKMIGTKGEARKELTAIRAKLDRRVLYSILKKAVIRDWIAKNPADPDRVKRPPKGNGRSQYLTVEEVGRLLDACDSHRYPIMLWGVETGMRPGEFQYPRDWQRT